MVIISLVHMEPPNFSVPGLHIQWKDDLFAKGKIRRRQEPENQLIHSFAISALLSWYQLGKGLKERSWQPWPVHFTYISGTKILLQQLY